MTDQAPYHRWSARKRRAFELCIQVALCIVMGCGVAECIGPPPNLIPCIQGK